MNRTNGYLKLAGWVTVLIAVGGLIWKASEFRSEVRTDMAWVKTSLATIVTRFTELDMIKTRVDLMDATGTSEMKEVKKRIEEEQKRIDRLERELEAHEISTGVKKP